MILECSTLDVSCTSCLNSTICETCSEYKAVYGSECLLSCPAGTYNNTGKCIPTPATSELQGAAAQVFAAAITVGSFVLFGGSQSVTTGLLAKIIEYIRYLDIDYSPELADLLRQDSGLVALNLIPDLPKSIQKRIPSVAMPHMFEEYGLEAPFLANFWPNLFGITIAFTIFVVSIVLQKLIDQRKKSKMTIVIRKLYLVAMNFLIVQIYCSFDEITLFFILQVKFLSFDSAFSYLSLILSLFFTVVGVASIIYHVWLIRKYQNIRNKNDNDQKEKEIETFAKRYEGLSLLFHDFKDTTSFHQSYLLLFILRNILANVFLGTIYEHPLVQTVTFVAFSLVMMGYIIIKRPFLEKLDLLEQIFYEGIIFGTNISVFIMALKQKNGTLYDVRESLGKGIIMMSLTFNIGALILILFRIFFLIFASIKSWRAKKAKKMSTTLPNKLFNENTGETKLKFKNSNINSSFSDFSQTEAQSSSSTSFLKDKSQTQNRFLLNREQRKQNAVQRIEEKYTIDSLSSVDVMKDSPLDTQGSVNLWEPETKRRRNRLLKKSSQLKEANQVLLKTKNRSIKKPTKKVEEGLEIQTVNKLNNPQSSVYNFDNFNIKLKSKQKSNLLEPPNSSGFLLNSSSNPSFSDISQISHSGREDLEQSANVSSLGKKSSFISTHVDPEIKFGSQNNIKKKSPFSDSASDVSNQTLSNPASNRITRLRGVDSALRKWKLQRAQDRILLDQNSKFLNLEDSISETQS